MRLLIAGVDPGTTIGIALLDLDGNILMLESGKNLRLSDLIQKSMAKGRVVLAGCDKKAVPEMVGKYATKLGVRVIAPDHDLLIEEKRLLVAGAATRNSHEFDSLASARHACRDIAALVRKIRFFCKRNHKEHLLNKIALLAIREGIGLRFALDTIEKPKEAEFARKVITSETVPRERVVQLYEMLASEKETTRALRKQNQALQEELRRLSSVTDYMQKKIDRLPRDDNELLRLRQEQIVTMGNQMKAMASEIEELKRELEAERKLFSNAMGKTILKRMKNLGSQEFEKKLKFLNVGQDDNLLIDDPGILSQEVLKKLAAMHITLIVRKKMHEKMVKEFGIAVINAVDLDIEDGKFFGLVATDKLEKAKSGLSMLKRIISDYQASRQ